VLGDIKFDGKNLLSFNIYKKLPHSLQKHTYNHPQK